jgi:hypothetical protein
LSFAARPYRRLYGAIFLSFTFAILIPLTSSQFDPTGTLFDSRGSFPLQTHLTFLGYLVALGLIAAGILVVKSIWSLALHGIRLSFSAKWAEKQIHGISLGAIVRTGFVTVQCFVVAIGVILLFTSDPGGLIRSQVVDETEIYARFTTQPTRFYETADLSSPILGTLAQNTCVSILDGSHQIPINGLLDVVANDGILNHKKGWVAESFLSKDRSAGVLTYLGDFITGMVHPITLKTIALTGLISGAVIGLFSLLFGRVFRRFGEPIAILSGVLFLVLRYSAIVPASIPGAMFLIPEACIVLLFDFALTRLILLVPPPAPVPGK